MHLASGRQMRSYANDYKVSLVLSEIQLLINAVGSTFYLRQLSAIETDNPANIQYYWTVIGQIYIAISDLVRTNHEVPMIYCSSSTGCFHHYYISTVTCRPNRTQPNGELNSGPHPL